MKLSFRSAMNFVVGMIIKKTRPPTGQASDFPALLQLASNPMMGGGRGMGDITKW